MCRVVKRFPQL